MLKIDVEYKKGVLFLRLIGKLNKETKEEFTKILEMANNIGFKYIMFNFEKLYSIDEEGIRIISDISRNLINSNRKILACGYNNLIRFKLEKSKIKDYALETNNELGAFKLINI